jgi:hypothetical protein
VTQREWTQRTFCVSHQPPLTPERLFDFAIGIGDYRPTRGRHVSKMDSFWHQKRPLAYGAAGNYVIPQAMDSEVPATELTGIFSHRKLIVRSPIGREAAKYPVFREISAATALQLPAHEVRVRDGYDFLIGAPVPFPQGIVQQYAQMHHAIDLFDYLSIAVRIGVLTPADVREFTLDTHFIPGGCELGIYPTAWLNPTLKKLEAVGRDFIIRWETRIRTYDSYQVRAVGFLAERLGSYLLLKELRRRYPEGLPRDLIGCLCVIVPDGVPYAGASVAT